jgi:hypothetical protein
VTQTLDRWLLVAFVAVTVTTNAQAECVRVFSSPAEHLASAALVFLGDVLKIETVIPESASEPFFYRVRVKVREAFKGTDVGERTFEVQPTAEDVKLEEGRLMLVYAYRNPAGKFMTQCTPTRKTALDDPEVATLRRASAAK